MKKTLKIRKFVIKEKEKLVPILFAILVALFYGNTLFNGFILDDNAVIVENIYVHSLRYLPKVVTGCIWEYVSGGCKGKTLHYRPFHSLSYLLTYQISSSAWFFHLVNLSYFFIAVFLVFTLAKTLTKNFILSFFAALFFLIHPINNEVVNWISAATDLLFSIFVSLTLIHYIKYRHAGSFRNFSLSLLFYFFAMLSKETAIVIPLILVFTDLLFFKTNIRELIKWKKLKEYLLFSFPLLIYFLMRFAVVGGFRELTGGREYFGGYYFPERIYAFFKLFAIYLGKIFYPYPLIFLHQFQIKSDLFNLEFFSYFAVFLVFLAAIYFFARRHQNLIVFSLVWFFIFLLPILLLFWAAGGNVYAERYLFVSSIGFGLAIASFFNYLWQKNKASKIIVSVLIIFITVASFLISYPRNKIWKDNITFFRGTLALNLNAHHIRESLAAELRQQGDIEGAKLEYEELIRRNPHGEHNLSHTYNNLGNYYREKGDFDRAQEYFEKAIQTSAQIRNYKSYNNLGALYMEKEKYLKALLYFCQALQIAPEAPEPLNNFNRVASIISSVEDENFIFLYMNVMDGEEFKKTAEEKIKYKRKFCAYDTCFYIFTPLLDKREIMLPFLIMAKAFPEEIVKIKSSSYNPESGEITLEINKKYQDRIITLYFPTCDGIYYEAVAKPKNKL